MVRAAHTGCGALGLRPLLVNSGSLLRAGRHRPRRFRLSPGTTIASASHHLSFHGTMLASVFELLTPTRSIQILLRRLLRPIAALSGLRDSCTLLHGVCACVCVYVWVSYPWVLCSLFFVPRGPPHLGHRQRELPMFSARLAFSVSVYVCLQGRRKSVLRVSVLVDRVCSSRGSGAN